MASAPLGRRGRARRPALAYSARGATAENKADRFASEFLLPEIVIRDELPSPLNLAKMAPLARRWGVSLQALVMRASQLNLISQRRAQQLYVELSTIGLGRNDHPLAFVRVEKPRAFRRMAEEVYGNPVDVRCLALDFNLPLPLAAAMLGAHATREETVAMVSDENHENVIPLSAEECCISLSARRSPYHSAMDTNWAPFSSG